MSNKVTFTDAELGHIQHVLIACDPKGIFGQTQPIVRKIQEHAQTVMSEQINKKSTKKSTQKKKKAKK